MTNRTLRLGAAALVTVALAACAKPADKPTVVDSAANATQTVVPTSDSTAKVDSALKVDSTAPTTETKLPTPDTATKP
ncbi:MAG: hypothetical protein IT355_06160 [Gemmatimonadaceae bacterium]|nr:hypothetical protein [Gemmatimonadaceae bacterium]